MDELTIKNELVKFGVTDAAIAELSTRYMGLTVKGLEDKNGLAIVHAARMDVKQRRISVEKTRKELKEDALRYGQTIDKEAKRITALLEPIENHLDSEEGKVQAEKDRIKGEADAKEAARIQVRIDAICAFGASFNGQMYVAYGLQIPVAIVKVCNDEQFGQFVAQIQEKKNAEDARIKAEEAARAQESERLAKVAAEQEAERLRLAEITRKQIEESAALELEKKRLADADTARLKAIEDEKKRVEDEKTRQAELEQARKEAAEKALKDAKEKADREAAEKIEKERLAKSAAEKKAARQPDKVKILLYADAVMVIDGPDIKSPEAKGIMVEFFHSLAVAIKILRDKTEAL